MIIKMILTNGFDPDPRVFKEAISLSKNGHQVEILAWDRQGDHVEHETQEIDGIIVRRFYPKAKYGNGLKQLKAYLKFLLDILIYLRKKKYDIVHAHDLDALLIGYFLKITSKNKKLFYDQHDLFNLYFKNRGKILLSSMINKIEKILLRQVDQHIVVTPNMKKMYEKQSKSIVVKNAPSKYMFSDIEKPFRNEIVIGFIGVIRYYKELEKLIILTSEFDNLKVFIAGKGPELNRIVDLISKNSYIHVTIFGEYNINDLEKLYKLIDVTYLIYPNEDSLISMPNKFFESIVTETPIISTISSEFGTIVKNQSLGWSISYENLDVELKSVLNELALNSNAISEKKIKLQNTKHEYYWENDVKKLLQIYK